MEALVYSVPDLAHLFAAPAVCHHSSEQLTSAALPCRYQPDVVIPCLIVNRLM